MRSIILSIIVLFIGYNIYSQGQKVIVNSEGVQVNVLQSDDNLTQIEYRIGEFIKTPVRIDGQTYYQISVEGETPLKEKGCPDLSKLCRSIVIPGNARMAITVARSEYIETKLLVAPSKGMLYRQTDPDREPYEFSSVYSTNAYYPSGRTKLGEPYIMRDVRGITVSLYPFSYNPVTRKLRVYTYLLVQVKNVGVDSKNVQKSLRNGRVNPYFKPIYSKHFINYQQAQDKTVDEDGRMLIICYDDFTSAMQPLVNWKNQSGLSTTMVALSQIGSTANDIKDYIQDEYDAHNGLTFVLLVGDSYQIPTFTVSGGASDPTYSLLDGNDNYPEIIVGRFSAETTAQVETQVERTIYYERDMTEASWWHKGIGIGSNQGDGVGDDGEADWQHIRNIRTQLLNYHYTSVDELYDGSHGGGDQSGSPTATMLSDLLNEGRSIINYSGHGDVTYWVTTGFSNYNVNNLTNVNKLPFIISVACVNGQFRNTTCFAESWLRATDYYSGDPIGAIGFYGSSVNQSWATPMEAEDKFNELLVNETNTSFGALCYNGACSMLDKYGDRVDPGCYEYWEFVSPNDDVPAYTTSEYLASHFITASNTISYGADIHYGCTNSVRLLNGFKAQVGSHFKADRDGCHSGGEMFLTWHIFGDPSIDVSRLNGNNKDRSTKSGLTSENRSENAGYSGNGLSIYPNPSEGLVNVVFTENVKTCFVTVTDMTGKVLFSDYVTGNKGQIQLTNYNPGIHILSITTDSGTWQKKLILE